MGWLSGTVLAWGRELEPALSLSRPQGPWDLGRGLLTDNADADSMALLGPMAGVGGHTTVGSLVLRPYLREEQHGAGGKGQGHALVGKRGQETIKTPANTSHTAGFASTSSGTLVPPCLPRSP